jgi:hypothetical protein
MLAANTDVHVVVNPLSADDAEEAKHPHTAAVPEAVQKKKGGGGLRGNLTKGPAGGGGGEGTSIELRAIKTSL